MILPQYIQFKDEKGSYLLCSHSPFLIGKIWKFKSHQAEAFNDWCENTHLPFSRIDGYLLAISYYGSLSPFGNEIYIPAILQDMNSWYLANVINEKQGYYKLFRQ